MGIIAFSIFRKILTVFTATFDGLFLAKQEFSELIRFSPNIKAIRDAASITENMQKNEFEKTVLNIFLKRIITQY